MFRLYVFAPVSVKSPRMPSRENPIVVVGLVPPEMTV